MVHSLRFHLAHFPANHLNNANRLLAHENKFVVIGVATLALPLFLRNILLFLLLPLVDLVLTVQDLLHEL